MSINLTDVGDKAIGIGVLIAFGSIIACGIASGFNYQNLALGIIFSGGCTAAVMNVGGVGMKIAGAVIEEHLKEMAKATSDISLGIL